MKKKELHWKVHTGSLLKETIENNEKMAILFVPFQIFRSLLIQVGEEAIRINDPALNRLMCQLTIYTCSDPESPDYDPKAVRAMMAMRKIKLTA